MFYAFVAAMVRAFMLLGLIANVALSQSVEYPTMALSRPLEYPKAKKGDVVDDYFGTKVPDPYRWLEDTDSPQTDAWVKAENVLTSGYMEKLADRADFREGLVKLLHYE